MMANEFLPPQLGEQSKFSAEFEVHRTEVTRFLSRFGGRLGYGLSTSPFIQAVVSNTLKAFPDATDEEKFDRVRMAVPFAYGRN